MKCQHCLRGDAQDIDIDFSTIDAFVEQTAKIYVLEFTGGEPTLNISAMQYTLEALRCRGIPLYSVEVSTNGAVLNRDFAETVKGFARYAAAWNGTVTVGVSKDRYHEGADPDAALDFYRQQLAGIATVKFMRRGEVPMRIGRGRMLAGAQPPYIIGTLPHKIETLEAGKYCGCKQKHLWPPPQEDEKIVCCRLSLSARGDLRLRSNQEEEYEAEDSHRDSMICNLSPDTDPGDRDIDHGIMKYNKCFPSCYDTETQESSILTATYKQHPRRLIQDAQCAYQLMQLDPASKASLLSQWPNMEEEFGLIIAQLEMLDFLSDDRLAELVSRSGLL